MTKSSKKAYYKAIDEKIEKLEIELELELVLLSITNGPHGESL